MIDTEALYRTVLEKLSQQPVTQEPSSFYLRLIARLLLEVQYAKEILKLRDEQLLNLHQKAIGVVAGAETKILTLD